MRNLIFFLLLAAVLLFSNTTVTSAKETIDVSGSASMGIYSAYMWRGMEVHEDTSFQPTIDFNYGGFGANLWADYNNDTNEHVETDLTLHYAFDMNKFAFDVGYIFYALDGIDDTQEVYLSVGYDILLSPTLTIYADIDEGHGSWMTASVGHSFEFPEGVGGVAKGMSINLGALASYNFSNEIMGFDENGDDFSDFYHGELSASVSIPIWKALTIEPMMAYSFALSDDSDDALEAFSTDGDSDHFYGGVTIALSFD